mmetsp:Transcript_47160/g.106854  ORF Transcript_47160/g.106854 Transcript_47160/m.106854 type:complete len:258 (-) Transcript_47160:211-984(-)
MRNDEATRSHFGSSLFPAACSVMGKKVVVYGACGVLGRSVVRAFNNHGGWTTIGVDLMRNDEATESVVVHPTPTAASQGAEVLRQIKMHGVHKDVNAIVCVSGGFAFGPISQDDCLEAADRMIASSVQASFVAARMAHLHLLPGGLLLLPGAAPAVGPTPMMIGYGTAKAAVHHMVRSLALPNSGLPDGCRVVGLAPVTLDTEQNRQDMPSADFSTWTNCDALGDRIVGWAGGRNTPANGAIVKVTTADGETTCEPL